MNKPSVFIGSSVEGLGFARAVRDLLTENAEITLWNEGFFNQGSTFIETLTSKVSRFDFGIFIFHSDDLTTSRGSESESPRDNVVFELGLFMGWLGRKRTFILHQVNEKLKIPSDLLGSSTLTYLWPRSDMDDKGAVGKACDEIRKAIEEEGYSENKTSKEISSIKSRQESIESSVSTLRLVMKGLVKKFEFTLLQMLAEEKPAMVSFCMSMYWELDRLIAIDYLQTQHGKEIADVFKDKNSSREEFDLRNYVRITEEGLEYLKLRRELSQF